MFFTRKDREDLCCCLDSHKEGLEAHDKQILELTKQVRDLANDVLQLTELLQKVVDIKPTKKGKQKCSK